MTYTLDALRGRVQSLLAETSRSLEPEFGAASREFEEFGHDEEEWGDDEWGDDEHYNDHHYGGGSVREEEEADPTFGASAAPERVHATLERVRNEIYRATGDEISKQYIEGKIKEIETIIEDKDKQIKEVAKGYVTNLLDIMNTLWATYSEGVKNLNNEMAKAESSNDEITKKMQAQQNEFQKEMNELFSSKFQDE